LLPLGFYAVIRSKKNLYLHAIRGQDTGLGITQWRVGPCALDPGLPNQWSDLDVDVEMQASLGGSYQVSLTVGDRTDHMSGEGENWLRGVSMPRSAQIEGVASNIAVTEELEAFCKNVLKVS
jgi:hypothetical protein